MITTNEIKRIGKSFSPEVICKMKEYGWSNSLVSHYKNGTKIVSAERAVFIQNKFGIPAEVMRPDLFVRRKI